MALPNDPSLFLVKVYGLNLWREHHREDVPDEQTDLGSQVGVPQAAIGVGCCFRAAKPMPGTSLQRTQISPKATDKETIHGCGSVGET